MKNLPLEIDQILLALVAACGFATSTWVFRKAMDSSDPRWLIAAMALLIVSYIPFVTLLGQSMSAAIVATGMLSQILALAIAFTVYGEPITLTRAFGLAAALLATLAFAVPAKA